MNRLLSKYTLDDIKRLYTVKFREAGLDTPALDLRLIIMEVLGVTHAMIIANGGYKLTREAVYSIQQLVKRRLSGEPIDSILGYRDFYGRRFHINKDVLSPRPETEGLVDLVLNHYAADSSIRCLDLGAGSGAIIVTLLAERLEWSGVAADISQAALDVVSLNAKAMSSLRPEHRHKLISDRLELAHSSWFEAVKGRFDLIVSNPPYIDKDHMERLSPEVKNYDPDLALYGGPDGLDAYRIIIVQAPNYLTRSGRLIFEIGYDQAKAVSDLMKNRGFSNVCIHKDLAGHDRLIEGIYT